MWSLAVRFSGHADTGTGQRSTPDSPGTERQDGVAGGRELLIFGKVRLKGFDFGEAHFFGVTFVVEEDVFCDPMNIRFAGAFRIMLEANGVHHLVEQFSPLLRRWRGRLGRRCGCFLSLCHVIPFSEQVGYNEKKINKDFTSKED